MTSHAFAASANIGMQTTTMHYHFQGPGAARLEDPAQDVFLKIFCSGLATVPVCNHWFHHHLISNQCIIKTTKRFIRCNLPSLQEIYCSRVSSQACLSAVTDKQHFSLKPVATFHCINIDSIIIWNTIYYSLMILNNACCIVRSSIMSTRCLWKFNILIFSPLLHFISSLWHNIYCSYCASWRSSG